ncbi:hypothetical protein H4S08_001307 [Coemansia sp. RSA 1365]|nr:hypothetical protein H4S08_001307 [Coemansia sp. RSA 1365]
MSDQDKSSATSSPNRDSMGINAESVSQNAMRAEFRDTQGEMLKVITESQNAMTAKLIESQERIAAGQNMTLESISNSQDAILRRIDSYISSKESLFAAPLDYSRNLETSADNLATPTKRGTATTGDSLVSHAISTPFVPHVRSSRNDSAHYIRLYEENERIFINVSIMMLLGNLGAEWMDAWHNLKSNGNGKIGVRWQDTHASVMPNGRRPDGFLQVGGSDVMTGWQNTVAKFELKSSRFDCTCSELRGQLLQGFIDMAEHQPRKHMLGLSISGAGEVHVYLCSLSEILYAKVGRLPIKGSLTDDGIAVIKLLLLMYTYLPSDYGFLVAKREGIYTRFGLADVFGCSLLNPDMDKNMIVEIRGGKATGGRNYHLVGARSWIYNARVDVDGDGHFEHLVFKFHWHCSGHSEIVVHKEVLGMGIPYVPKLV